MDDGLTRAQVEITKQLMADVERQAAEIERLRANCRGWYDQNTDLIQQRAKVWEENRRLRAALTMIADIAEGSGTVNSLPNIAKIARGACEQREREGT